ncbi:MAG: hypothetical protein K0R82_2944 [Flavipsychrobacter sp.]|nr:hypothetical protein [Flavipsychrobacter sp.]
MKHLLTGLIALSLSFTTFAREAFIENKGQITDQYRQPNSNVLYLYNGHGLNVQLRKTGFSYDIWQTENNGQARFNRVDIDFVNSSAAMTTHGSGRSADMLNYYTEYTPEKGITAVRSYDKVLYKNVWAGIDVEFLLAGEKPKYNFILHPGAKLADIKLDIKGAKSITQNGNGLSIATTLTTLEETVPYSYYSLAAGKTEVNAKLQANSDGSYGVSVSQNIPANATLVIDPMPNVQWATYYGGTGTDYGKTVITDTLGNVYFIGTTYSANAIATAGTYEDTYFGLRDAFVAKFNPAGARIWGTYYGGYDDELGMGIAIEKSGLNLYISGYTQSTSGIATTGAHLTSWQGLNDAYLAKFDSAGQRLWSTYYGDANFDQGRSVAIDDANNVYLTGDTRSGSNIATPGAFQTNNGGWHDGFIVKFTPGGVRVWATFYGGNDDEYLNSTYIVNNRIYIGGQTTSSFNVTSPGAYQPTKGGSWDVFLAKFDTAGARLWSTYYGGSGMEVDVTTGLDENANIYVTGYTTSPNVMATPGAHQATKSFSEDGFISKFDSTGVRIWSTYYGGNSNDAPKSVTAAKGHIFLTGVTYSTTGISTPNALYPGTPGGNQIFISKFDSAGKIKWGTYYGDAEGNSITSDRKTAVYVTGASGNALIGQPGSHQPTKGGVNDGFLIKLNVCDDFATASANNPVLLNGTINLQASGGSQYQWSHANGFSSTLPNPSIPNAQLTDSGTYTVIVTDLFTCTNTIKVNVHIQTQHIDDALAKAFRIYPNPSATYVMVENTDGLTGTIELLTVDGRLIYNSSLAEQQQKIDVSSLAAGTYFLKINTSKGTANMKLLKE